MMIASVVGKVELKTVKYLVLGAGELGYKIFCSNRTLDKINQGETVKLFTHLHLREGVMDLYGFLSFDELEFFGLLISVSGIGPKAGLGVLSVASLDDIRASIASGQAGLLTKVSGIGKKTAERIILELRSKIMVSGESVKKLIGDDEAFDALVGLGYSSRQAADVLKRVPAKIKRVEDRIKQALKLLSR